jgi:hypothetical protein
MVFDWGLELPEEEDCGFDPDLKLPEYIWIADWGFELPEEDWWIIPCSVGY